MSKTLYAIQTEYEELFERLEEADGLPPEQLDELLALLEINETEFKAKAEAYAAVIREKKARAEFLKSEAARLAAMAKAEESLADRLSARIQSAMTHQGLSKVETEHYRFSLRASQAVEVSVEPSLLPAAYRKTAFVADKQALKAALERGEAIVGVQIVTRQNLQIK